MPATLHTSINFDDLDAIADISAVEGMAYGGTLTVEADAPTGSNASLLLTYTAGQTTYAKKSLSGAKDLTGLTFYVLLRIKPVHASPTSSYFFECGQDGTGGQLRLGFNSSRNILAYRGTTLIGTGTSVIPTGVYTDVLLKWYVANAGGICEVKIGSANASNDITFSGDTQQQTANTTDYIAFGYPYASSNQSVYYNKCVIFTGDWVPAGIKVARKYVNGDGATSWSHNTGSTNWECLDEVAGTYDDNTSYIYQSSTGVINKQSVADIANAGTIYGVKLYTRMGKADATDTQVKHGVLSGGTAQTVRYGLSIGYAMYEDYFLTSDGASTAWTQTTFNTIELTAELV